MGLFNKKKPVNCRHCGKEVMPKEQTEIGKDSKKFILCRDCLDKIGHYFNESMKNGWDYDDYVDFLKWDEEMKPEREVFTVSYKYPENPDDIDGYVEIDNEHKLFRVLEYSAMIIPPNVYRFKDLVNCEIDEELIERKKTLFGMKFIGEQFFAFTTERPLSYVKITLKRNTAYGCDKALNDSKYNDFIRHFTTVAYIADQEKLENQIHYSIEEYKKALEYFRYECIQNITLEELKNEKEIFLKDVETVKNNVRDDYEKRFTNAYKILYEAVSMKK